MMLVFVPVASLAVLSHINVANSYPPFLHIFGKSACSALVRQELPRLEVTIYAAVLGQKCQRYLETPVDSEAQQLLQKGFERNLNSHRAPVCRCH